MMILRIDHVHIHSSDVKKTVEFFEKMLDGKLVMDKVTDDNFRIIRVKVGDVHVNIFPRPPGVPDPKPENASIHYFAFRVDNFDDVVDKLKKRGARFVRGPLIQTAGSGKSKVAYIAGPDNVTIEIIETTMY